jgi:hypothetical protein
MRLFEVEQELLRLAAETRGSRAGLAGLQERLSQARAIIDEVRGLLGSSQAQAQQQPVAGADPEPATEGEPERTPMGDQAQGEATGQP